MKAKHRHELKTNELADWLAHFPQWAKENLKRIIYVSIVAVLVAGSYIYHKYQKVIVQGQQQHDFTSIIAPLQREKMNIVRSHSEGFDDSFELIQTANKLRGVAQNTKNENMAALALIKQAEALRSELYYRLDPPSKQEIENQINLAKGAYQQAIEKSSTNPSLAAKATLGLGLCEEELGNFEQANQIYNDIVDTEDFEGTTASAEAGYRLETMDDYKQKLVFKASSKPTPQQELPQLQLSPVDINLPTADINPPTENIEVPTEEINLPTE